MERSDDSENLQGLGVVGKEIRILFDLLLRSPLHDAIEGYSAPAWGHESQRFGLWANNLGLHHGGHSSLDYRLREATTLRRLFRTLLDNLKVSLYELRDIAISAGCLPSEASKSTNAKFLEEDDQYQSDDDSSFSDEDFTSSESAAEVLLAAVVDTVNNLYRLATKVRNPKLRLPTSKARFFKRVNDSTGVDLIDQMRLADLKHVEELVWEHRSAAALDGTVSDLMLEDWDMLDNLRKPKHLNVEDQFLISRLAQANTYRRQQFGHWRRHRDKNIKETAEVLGQPTALLAGAKTLAALSKPSTATHLHNPSALGAADGRSSTSTSARTIAPKVIDARDEDVMISPPPVILQREVKINASFECPYCFMICPASLLKSDGWREHIFRDLRPYVCTYANCSSGDQIYDSWKDWTTHERWAHSKIWQCADHPTCSYPSASDFSQHLQAEHGQERSKLELDQMSSMSEIITDDRSRPCPICLCSLQNIREPRNHIATHLQRIARFALPRSLDMEDASDAGSSSARANALSQESQDLGSSDEEASAATSIRDIDDASRPVVDETLPSPLKLAVERLESLPQEGLVERVNRSIEGKGIGESRKDDDQFPPRPDDYSPGAITRALNEIAPLMDSRMPPPQATDFDPISDLNSRLSAETSDQPDSLLLEHEGKFLALELPRGSIRSYLTIRSLRQKANRALGLWTRSRQLELHFDGRTLRDNHKTCREEGLQSLCKITCVVVER